MFSKMLNLNSTAGINSTADLSIPGKSSTLIKINQNSTQEINENK